MTIDATREALRALKHSEKTKTWLARHLDYYLKCNPLPGGLEPERAITHIRNHRGEEWQKRQVIEVVQLLFQCHDVPVPSGLYSASLAPSTTEKHNVGQLPADPDEAKVSHLHSLSPSCPGD